VRSVSRISTFQVTPLTELACGRLSWAKSQQRRQIADFWRLASSLLRLDVSLVIRMHNRKRPVWPPPHPSTASGRQLLLKRSGFGERLREGASLVNRNAVTELRKHAVRSWETREANASEEPGSARWPEGCLVSRKVDFQNSVQQIFGRPDAK
jgi:hypothetical protein